MKKKVRNRTKFVIAAMIAIVLYAAVCIVRSWFDKTISDTLTTCWFAAWTVELALLAGIKIKDKE